MRIANFILIPFVAAVGQTPGHARPLPPAQAALRACLESRAAQDAFSGAMLVAEKGKILWQAGYGHADAAHRIPNGPETRFNIASAGKMFTSVAIGQLADAGRLRFDDPLGRHLPGLPDAIGAITIDQLLTHRSGLRDYLQPRNREAIHAARTATDLLPLAIADGLAFAPGSQQSYSNSGYVVLGALIEKLSGLSYADYVERNIFAPAGMKATRLDGTGPRAEAMTRMRPDGSQADGPRRPAPVIGGPRGTPAGGATSTVGDMFRFAEALRRHRLTKPGTTELLWRAHVASRRPGQTGEISSYGYGFTRDEMEGARILGHGGGSPGANAQIDIYPESRRVVVALANYDPPAATEAVLAARRAFLGRDPVAICVARP